MLLLTSLDIWTIALYVVLALVLVLLMVLPTRLRRRSLAALRQTEEAKLRESIDKLLVDLQEIGRQMNAKLETNIRVLNRMIEEAEEKRKELSALIERASSLSMPVKEAEPRPDPLHLFTQRYSHIYKLADEGKGLLDIAELTGMPPGEIDFVLALRRGKKET